MELKLKLRTPNLPNFIAMEMPKPFGKRQDGLADSPTVDIADLSDEQLSEIADQWKVELLKHAHKRRSNRE